MVRPAGRSIDLAPEIAEIGEIRILRLRQWAGREHHEPRPVSLAGACSNSPETGVVIPPHGGHPSVERHMPAQAETVGDVLDIAQNFFLRRIALSPIPLVLKLFRERITVVDGQDVAAGARVAVVIPDPAHISGRLETEHVASVPQQPVDSVDAAEARTDDDYLVIRSGLVLLQCARAVDHLSHRPVPSRADSRLARCRRDCADTGGCRRAFLWTYPRSAACHGQRASHRQRSPRMPRRR